jgi:hypothetical protein
MKNVVFWDNAPWGPVRTEVSEEFIVSIIRVIKIGELCRFLYDPHGLTSQRAVFIRGQLHTQRMFGVRCEGVNIEEIGKAEE